MPRASLPKAWVNGSAFGATILRGGENPWLTPGEYGFFQRDLASLMKLVLIDIDTDLALDAYLAISDRKINVDDVGDLEDLLLDAAFAAHLKRGIETVMGIAASRPVALSLPGPGLLSQRYLANETIDENVLDDLSMAQASLLREIFRPDISFVRITENRADALEMLSPLSNLASHYECTSVLLLRDEAANTRGACDFNFVYRENGNDSKEGYVLGGRRLLQTQKLPDHPSCFVDVPADAMPEMVLMRLASLPS